MLAPQPERTSRTPKPTKILSKEALRTAWRSSRDSRRQAGRPGIDNETAEHFKAKLEANLDDIVKRLREGRYGFSRLRVVFIPKPDSDKERIICIPTVRDRLVQRAIAEHLTTKAIFPINNSSSFGFIKGRSPRHAINRALELRTKYDWCLKTDIQSFFDRIPRAFLKENVSKVLRGSSLEPLLYQIIDCEAKATSENKERIRRHGLVHGQGVRQGMPLSPLLANLMLADFDRDVERRGLKMVRYADDLVLFFRTKEEAQEGKQFLKLWLATIQLSIPEIADGSKTKLVSRSDSLEFLGREIVFLGSQNSFVAKIGAKQIEKIRARLTIDFSFQKRSAHGKNFQDTVVDLSKSISAYLGLYQDAFNYRSFEQDIKGLGRSIVIALFRDLFGEDRLRALTPEGRKFLGIEVLDSTEPNAEWDV